jgi:AcrR family transcriptional regulator
MARKTNLGKRRAAAAVDSSPLYRERKRAILAAAAKVFLQRGYEATTLAHIAEELKYDRATLYYYASSKQEIFQAMVRQAAEKNLETIEEIVKQDRPASEKLRNALMSLMQSYSTMFPFLQLFLQQFLQNLPNETPEWGGESRAWAARYYQAVRSILQQGVDEGEFELALPVGVTAMGVIGTVNWAQVTGTARRQRKSETDLTPEQIGSGFADMLLSGFQKQGAKPRVSRSARPAPKPAPSPRAAR